MHNRKRSNLAGNLLRSANLKMVVNLACETVRKSSDHLLSYNDITAVTDIIGKRHSNGSLVHSYRVVDFGCDDRFETALPRQGAGECRMAAKIWV